MVGDQFTDGNYILAHVMLGLLSGMISPIGIVVGPLFAAHQILDMRSGEAPSQTLWDLTQFGGAYVLGYHLKTLALRKT